MTSYKFFKHQNGISSFAVLSLELANGSPGHVEWAANAAHFEAIYGEMVRLGVRDALRWHSQDGGASTAFRILDLTELLVDTKPDAVRCAATGAAWKALGHDEADIIFTLNEDWQAERKS